jgi:predicted nucleic acid-binding protein
VALVFVDTSAWWALFDRGDGCHAQAKSAFAELVANHAELVTTDYVVDELVTGLLGRVGHTMAVRAGRGIRESALTVLVFVGPDLFHEAWQIFERHDRMRWSLTDCTSMAVMKSRGIRRAFTFDDDFRKMGFDALPRPR